MLQATGQRLSSPWKSGLNDCGSPERVRMAVPFSSLGGISAGAGVWATSERGKVMPAMVAAVIPAAPVLSIERRLSGRDRYRLDGSIWVTSLILSWWQAPVEPRAARCVPGYCVADAVAASR